MNKKVKEKVIDISGETSLEDTFVQEEQLSRRNRHDKPKNNKKRRGNLFMNLLTLVAVVGMIAGGGILGKTLWDEYQRSEATKTNLNNAAELVNQKISREEFAPGEGEIVGMIIFPDRDNMQVPIIEGMREEDLHAGIGHEPVTGWPGDGRQIFLAGHRNTEFGVLKNVVVGETIIMDMTYGTFTYKIVSPPDDDIPGEAMYAGKVIKATQTNVINPSGSFGNDQLVLMTCYPFTFGASLEERFLIYAERIE